MLGQEESFKDKSITFFIKSRSYFSKQLADSINNKSPKTITLEPINLKDTNVVILNDLPSVAHYDSKSIKYFRINPKNYVFFEVRNIQDSIINEGNFTNISMISRDSLKQSVFRIDDFKMLDYRFNVTIKDFSKSFILTNTNKENQRKIAGYNCYEVILENDSKILQLFVTNEIKLNYHPQINDREILKKYYPLSIKIMNKKYPKRSFTESIFYRGLY